MKVKYFTISDIMKDKILSIKKRCKNEHYCSGISSGFSYFDNITTGFHNGELILIASRPSNGKSAFVINLMLNIGVRQKKKLAFFSLQMSKENVAQRILCSETKTDINKMRYGCVRQEDLILFNNAVEKISDSNIYIVDSATISISKLYKTVKKIYSKHGLDIIIIDYLQLIRPKKKKYNLESKDIVEILAILKRLAQKNDIPIIVLYELSQPFKKKYRPSITDLDSSKAIEYIADIVIFIYRDELYNVKTNSTGIAEIIIQKQRNGPPGMISLRFFNEYGRFEDIINDKVK